MEQRQAEIKTRIAELREKYARLQSLCRYGARVSKETTKQYAREIESLQIQLN